VSLWLRRHANVTHETYRRESTMEETNASDAKPTVRKRISLVAHDNRKRDLIEWVHWNYRVLRHHALVCTGTTGRLVDEALRTMIAHDGTGDPALDITRLKSGPLGGDQQLGAMIAEGKIDLVIFFWDPMEPHPHDVDVKALLRIAVVYNVPIACNRSTADFIISSPLLLEAYEPRQDDTAAYLARRLPDLGKVDPP
jgi:methylglyoxal synthase